MPIISSRITKFLAISLLVCNVSLASAYDDQMKENDSYSLFDKLDLKEYIKIGAGVTSMAPDVLKFSNPGRSSGLLVSSGYNLKYKFRPSPLYNVGLGYRVNNFVRGDINFQFTELKAKGTGSTSTGQSLNGKFDLRSVVLMANGYFGVPVNKTFSPYISAGVGVRKYISAKLVPLKSKDEYQPRVVWNVGAGTEINFHSKFGMEVEYRYMTEFGKYKFITGTLPATNTKTRFANHQGLISLVYKPA